MLFLVSVTCYRGKVMISDVRDMIQPVDLAFDRPPPSLPPTHIAQVAGVAENGPEAKKASIETSR